MTGSIKMARWRPEGLRMWAGTRLSDYECITRHAPIVEDSLTQVGKGHLSTTQTIISLEDVTVLRHFIRPLSVGWAVPDRAYLCFLIPLAWAGRQVINGINADFRHVFTSSGSDGFFVRGEARDYIGVCVCRAPLLATIAALSGADPEDFGVPERVLVLRADRKARLVSGLMQIIETFYDLREGGIAPESIHRMRNVAIELIADACLSAAHQPDARARKAASSASIVRHATDCFARAEGKKVSLADLCAASGASKSRLYLAFDEITGETPLALFNKWRLNLARSSLVRSAPEPGAVTRAALNAGLTELGRFSVEYRQLFGESPSVTLRERGAKLNYSANGR